nr:SURF1 family protein [Microbacterium amylolyticum]
MYVGIAIIFAIVCAFLSYWQFERNETRAVSNHLIANNYDATPAPFASTMQGTEDFDPSDEWQPVVLTGEYLADDQLLVRNRAQGGTAAYEAVVPFLLDDGRILAVSRGWVPPDYAGGHEAVPAPPAGDVTVVARLRPSEPLPTSNRSAPDGQLPTLHAPSIAELTGENTVTAVYAIMVSEDPAPEVRPNELAAPDEDPGPHLSYAIQWILFAIMGFVFIAYMIRTEIRAGQEPEDNEDDELEGFMPDEKPKKSRRRQPRQKRRDEDMQAEDALLDA